MYAHDHTRREILRTVHEYAKRSACLLREFRGRTLGSILLDAERSGCTMFWGFWTWRDLQMTI